MTTVSPRKDHRARVPALESSPARFAVIRDSGQGSLTERQVAESELGAIGLGERILNREVTLCAG